MIHGGYEHAVMVSIESHEMVVISADGSPVRPMLFDSITLYPGERYDIYVKALDDPSRKVYRMIVRTEERFPSMGKNGSEGVLMPIYGLADLEYEDVVGEATDTGIFLG